MASAKIVSSILILLLLSLLLLWLSVIIVTKYSPYILLLSVLALFLLNCFLLFLNFCSCLYLWFLALKFLQNPWIRSCLTVPESLIPLMIRVYRISEDINRKIWEFLEFLRLHHYIAVACCSGLLLFFLWMLWHFLYQFVEDLCYRLLSPFIVAFLLSNFIILTISLFSLLLLCYAAIRVSKNRRIRFAHRVSEFMEKFRGCIHQFCRDNFTKTRPTTLRRTAPGINKFN